MTRNPDDGYVNVGLVVYEAIDTVNGGLDEGLSGLFARLCHRSNRGLTVSVDSTLFCSFSR